MQKNSNGKPLLNPVLTFLASPSPRTVPGGGKNAKSIIQARLGEQRSVLSEKFTEFAKKRDEIKSHNNKTHVIARMFPDSHASSWTPKDIFRSEYGCRIIAPAFDGYLIETDTRAFETISSKISTASSIVDKVDISRVQSVDIFDAKETLRGESPQDVWGNSEEELTDFNFWLLPFSDINARISVRDEILKLYKDKKITLGDDEFSNPFKKEGLVAGEGSDANNRLIKILENYVNFGIASFSAKIKNINDLNQIASSGTTYRIEPVSRIASNSTPPGNGKEPILPGG